MNQATKNWPAIQATSAKARDGVVLAMKIAERLQAYINAAAEGHGNWGTHGDVGHVREQLREIAQFLDIADANQSVERGHGCPQCGEHQADFLQVDEDDPVQVTCLCCNKTYRLS